MRTQLLAGAIAAVLGIICLILINIFSLPPVPGTEGKEMGFVIVNYLIGSATFTLAPHRSKLIAVVVIGAVVTIVMSHAGSEYSAMGVVAVIAGLAGIIASFLPEE